MRAALYVVAALTLGGHFADIPHEDGTTFICATHDPVLIGFADDDVQSANANLMGQVSLAWDDEKTTREALVAAMAKAGFREAELV